jgi:hypothetical protein
MASSSYMNQGKILEQGILICWHMHTHTHKRNDHLPAYAPLPHVPHPSSFAFLSTGLVLLALSLLQLVQPSKQSYGTQHDKILMMTKINLKYSSHKPRTKISSNKFKNLRKILPMFLEAHSFLILTSW